MDLGDSLSNGSKIKSIASVVTEKNSSKVQDYEQILVFFYEQKSSGCELLMVSAHYEFITPPVSITQCSELIGFCLE